MSAREKALKVVLVQFYGTLRGCVQLLRARIRDAGGIRFTKSLPFTTANASTACCRFALKSWIVFFIGARVCLYWLRALRLAREGPRLFLRNLAQAVLVFGLLMLILPAFRLQTHLQQSHEKAIAGFLALISFGLWQGKKRSRYIPKATRRAVIATDLKGETFDPEKHHIDHVWPFSKGGSNTVDNLRVVEKRKNLQKGAKRPRVREMR